jgi:DNA-directed RNA polymerase specialized sigma24 family protein
MTEKIEINKENFEELLNWLAPDRELAGQIYESIRDRLIKIFYSRGCQIADEMADETIDRVTKKIKILSATYEGNPSMYFYGVAKKVLLEYSRKPKPQELPVNILKTEMTDDVSEKYYECLDKCLMKMPGEQNQLILEYYQGEKRAKINQRKTMMLRLGISNQTLRVRLSRMREVLQKCVSKCVEGKFC